MNPRRNGRVIECVAVDLNTQRDFCDQTGAYPVANIPQLIPAVRRVVAWTRRHHVPVISSVESHRLWEVPSTHRALCCIDGTAGQRKVEFTLFPNRVWVEVDNTLAVPTDLFKSCQQVIFPKRTDDLLANPKADRFLTHLVTEEFIVFGNGVECAVKALSLGLLARNRRVTIVIDACGYWDQSLADLALRQIVAKGAKLVTSDELIARTAAGNGDAASVNGHNGNGKNGTNGRNGTTPHANGSDETSNGNGRRPRSNGSELPLE